MDFINFNNYFYIMNNSILIFNLFIFHITKGKFFFFFNMFYCDTSSIMMNYLNILIFMTFLIMKISIFNYIYLMSLYIIMMFMFSSQSLIQLYIFFELSLIPIFLIIQGSGKQFERIKAGLFLLFLYLLEN